MTTEDTLERCENRLSFLSNKVLEYEKTKQQIQESAENTKAALSSHLKQIKESLIQNLDQNYERLCMLIDETVNKDLQNLAELEEHVHKDVNSVNKLVDEVKSQLEANLEKVNRRLNDLGRSHSEVPIVSLSFTSKVNENAMTSIEEKLKEALKISMTGSVQIVECLERPGSIVVRWDEQPMSDSESVATDASTFAEYILQATTKNDHVFYTVYEGENLEYTMNFAEPNKEYQFRVCQAVSSSSGSTVCGAWSVVKSAVTSLSPHVWNDEDCATESDLQLYQLSNGGRTATKIFPESSRILRSKEPSYKLGQHLTFWVDETGESSTNDGIGLICGSKQISKQFTSSPNTTVMTSKGNIFVNGIRMTTRLPSLKKNSIVVFHTTRLFQPGKSCKYRVSISVDDKEVTFDWSTSIEGNEDLYFGCVFEHTGWQLSVG